MDLIRERDLPDIILFAQTEESSNFRSALGAQSLRHDNVGQPRDVGFALLDDRESEDCEVLADDTAADGFALAFAGSTGTVAGVAFSEKEADTGREHLCGEKTSLSEYS